MPHLKCEACRVRLHSPQSPIDGVGELCPACGSLLEPVSRVSELVGLRLIRWEPSEDEAERDAWRALGDYPVSLPEAVAQVLPRPEPTS